MNDYGGTRSSYAGGKYEIDTPVVRIRLDDFPKLPRVACSSVLEVGTPLGMGVSGERRQQMGEVNGSVAGLRTNKNLIHWGDRGSQSCNVFCDGDSFNQVRDGVCWANRGESCGRNDAERVCVPMRDGEGRPIEPLGVRQADLHNRR